MENSIVIAIGRFVRFCFVAVIFITLTGCLLVLLDPMMDAGRRTAVLGVLMLPSLLFAVGHFFFESQRFERIRSPKQVIWALTCLMVLLLPPLYLLLRHDLGPQFRPVWKTVTLSIAMPLCALWVLWRPGAIELEDRSIIKTVMNYLRIVMWDSWEGSRHGWRTFATVSVDDTVDLKAVRSPMYLDKERVRRFQETLTCAKWDSEEAYRMIDERLSIRLTQINGRGGLRILDIGCADGSFTSSLAREFQIGGYAIQTVLGIDPAPWETEWHQALGTVGVPAGNREYVRATLEDVSIPGHFDVVLASHSLYGPFDNAWDRDNCVSLLKKLTAACGGGGVCLVVLASGAAISYQMKGRLLKAILGREIEDATFEKYRDVLKEGLQLEDVSANVRTVDNILKVESLLGGHDRNSSSRIADWLAYFVRVDLHGYGSDEIRALADIVERYAQPARSLPAELLARATIDGVGSGARVILHKSVVLCAEVP